MKIVHYADILLKSMKKINLSRIKNLFRYLKKEGVQGTKKRLLECIYDGAGNRMPPVAKVRTFQSAWECERLELAVCNKPKVSVILPVYNEFAFTYQCLASIVHAADKAEMEVILADDHSTDLTRQICSVVSNLKVVRSEHNVGFLRNCNQAAEHASGEYLFFLNNDTQVQKGWLDTQLRLMEEDPSIGMTGAKLVYADGRLQEAGGIIWKDGSAWNYGNGQDSSAPEYNYVKDVDYLSGAAIMIRAGLWRQVGGFDVRFAPAYCEDSDLAFAVRKAGYRVVYQPQSVVVHYEGVSNGKDVHTGIKKYQLENTKKLYEKWKHEIQRACMSGKNVFQSRERSKGKKVILFVDHYVPMPDRDAGSRTVYQYVRMFLNQGFQVKFVGDNYHKSEPYTQRMQQMGVEVLYGAYYQKHFFTWLEENKQWIDFAFLNRPHISIKYIDYFREKTDIKIIYYGHDLHFLRNRREYALTKDPKKEKEAKEWEEQEFYLMRHAHISYYPSQIEADEVQKIDPAIRVKAVTAYAFDTFPKNQQNDFAKREGILFVGGFAHDPNQDAVLWFVKEVYPLIRKERQVAFMIAGSYPTSEIEKLDGKNGIIVKAFASEEELASLYASCRIAVVPLRYGAGVKGKVVEALYHGIPVVTTPIGAEGIGEIRTAACIVEEVQSQAAGKAFAAQIVSLYDDTVRLREMSIASQELARKQFSMDAVWEKIKEDFEKTFPEGEGKKDENVG